jgi:hypothetical protein
MNLRLAVVFLALGSSNAFVSRANLPRTLTTLDAAISFEEDLELTRKVIFQHIEGSASNGATKVPAAAVPAPVAAKVEEKKAAPTAIDISIPYDAAARLEFDASNKSFDAKKFEVFKKEYYTKTVAMVSAKKAARDGASAPAKAAPAKVAAAPKASGVDISVEYDSAAKLAFTHKFGAFDEKAFVSFKKEYEAAAVAMVTAKQQARSGDLSVPYDAPAKLAFMIANDNVFDAAKYAKFKKDYEAKAVAEVSAKKK